MRKSPSKMSNNERKELRMATESNRVLKSALSNLLRMLSSDGSLTDDIRTNANDIRGMLSRDMDTVMRHRDG